MILAPNRESVRRDAAGTPKAASPQTLGFLHRGCRIAAEPVLALALGLVFELIHPVDEVFHLFGEPALAQADAHRDPPPRELHHIQTFLQRKTRAA